MDSKRFRALYDSMKVAKPQLLMQGAVDDPPTEQSIEEIEHELGAALPMQYKSFLTEYGGGEIGFLVIYSLDQKSEWDLLKQLIRYSFPRGFVPISDDQTGGYYLLKLQNENDNSVYFWSCDSKDLPEETAFPTIYDFTHLRQPNCLLATAVISVAFRA